MTRIEITIRGTNRIANKLRTLASQMPQIADPIVRRFMEHVRAVLKSMGYPAAPAGSTYQRTGELANRWAVEGRGSAVYAIVNRASRRGRFYGGYVVGDSQGQGQAWMHQGRWWLFHDVVERETPQLTAELSEAFVIFWES